MYLKPSVVAYRVRELIPEYTWVEWMNVVNTELEAEFYRVHLKPGLLTAISRLEYNASDIKEEGPLNNMVSALADLAFVLGVVEVFLNSNAEDAVSE